MSQLPQGWETVYFKDAIEIIRGVTFSKQDRRETSAEGYIPCLRTSNIQETIEVDDLAYIPVQLVKQKDRFIRPDDIIISMSNSRELVGKVAKADASLNGFTYGAFLSVLRSSKFNPDFLYYLLRSPRVQHEMRLTAGQTVNIANLSISGMSKIQLPLPPIAEQRRIVARLDSLLAQSKAARAELNKALALAKRQRQAVLAKAFSGEWKKTDSDWSQRPLGELASLQLGKMLDKYKNKGNPVQYLRNVNVRWFSFNLSELLEMPFTDNELDKFSIQDGDLIICEGGEPGRAAIWKHGPTHIKYQKALHRVRVNNNVLPEWILYQLYLKANTAELSQYFTGTTIKHLPKEALSAIPFISCPLEEQKEIVKRVEAAFAQIETMENEAKKALALAERLEQATLAKAFQGQL